MHTAPLEPLLTALRAAWRDERRRIIRACLAFQKPVTAFENLPQAVAYNQALRDFAAALEEESL